MTCLAIEHQAINLSQSFPDFPAPAALKEAAMRAIGEDVNQYTITWGIEAYQVAGRPVSEEVLAVTVEWVVAACKRLGLDSSRVLGYREIDLDRRDDPVGVDMDDFRAEVAKALLAEAEAHQVLQFNPNAALQSPIFADGFVSNSPEFDVQIGGLMYHAQRAEHLGTGRVHAYYARVGDWANVRFVERT